jgi:hypothetical protein
MGDLTGQKICQTYPKLVQIDTGSNTIQDGLGNIISILPTTSSYAVTASYTQNALSASYATSASYEINYETSSSYSDFAVSASYAVSASHVESASIADMLYADDLHQSVPVYREGQLFWDSGSHTFALYNDAPDMTLQIGQETIIRVVAGEYIPNGSPVYISSSQATYPCVKLALADGTRTYKYQVIGIATHNINSGSQGFVTVQGRVNDVNTAAFPAGTGLWLSNINSGSFIGYPPAQPYEKVLCGYCLYQDALNGKILVDVIALPESVNVNVGIVDAPSISNVGGGTFIIGTGSVNLNTLASGKGVTKNYQLASQSFTLTSSFLDAHYICATYNSGSPIYDIHTDRSEIDDIQDTLVYTVLMGAGSVLSYTSWDSPGLLLANKLHVRTINVNGIEREDGLVLAESGSRYATLTLGYVYQGVQRFTLPAVNSSTDRFVKIAHSASVWSGSLMTQFVNDQYDDGANLQTLSNNYYVNNWVYRAIGSNNSTVIQLSTEYAKLADAVAAQPPSPPAELKDVAILTGRAIYKKSVATAEQVDSAFTQNFTPAGITDHNVLNNLQGGTTGEYYHLTATEHTGSGTGVFIRQINPHLSGSVQITGSLNVSGGITGSLNITTPLILENTYIEVASGSPSTNDPTGSLYIDNFTSKLSIKINSGSEWEGIGHWKVCYLTVSASTGTISGTNGCHLLAPSTWSVSEFNTAYYIDDTAGNIQVQIPDVNDKNIGKGILLTKPRIVTSANQVEIITPSGQAVGPDAKFYLRSAEDRGYFIGVPFVGGGAPGYKYRFITTRQETRKEITVGEHGCNFTTVSGAIQYFNTYGIDDTLITVRPGTYAEAPMRIQNNNGYNLKLQGQGSSLVNITPQSLVKNATSSLFLVSTSCDFQSMTIDGTALTGYGLHSKDDLVRITGSNSYYEFRDVFMFGGYETLCVPVNDSEVYMLDVELAYASSSAIEMESNSELDIIGGFFFNNPKSVYIATGSNVNISLETCHFDVEAGEVGVFYKSGSVEIDAFDILGNIFIGGGTYFSGSTLFSSEEDRKIQIFGNAGLVDNKPFGLLRFEDNTVVMASSPAGTTRKASGSNASVIASPKKFESTNNRLTYRARQTKDMLVTLTGTVTAQANGQTIGIAVVKNANSASFSFGRIDVRCITNGVPINFSTQAIIPMSSSDYIEVWATNRTSATNTYDIDTMAFIAKE